MSVFEVLLGRRSIRKYLAKDISQDVLNQIFEAGRHAPSAVNRQPYRFVVVTELEIKKALKGLFSRFIEHAPVVVVGCADTNARLTGKWATIDTAIALENMVIMACSLGVGSCWIGSFDEKKVKELLKIPDKWKVVALVALGYPDEQPKNRKKKPLEDLFGFNSF